MISKLTKLDLKITDAISNILNRKLGKNIFLHIFLT